MMTVHTIGQVSIAAVPFGTAFQYALHGNYEDAAKSAAIDFALIGGGVVVSRVGRVFGMIGKIVPTADEALRTGVVVGGGAGAVARGSGAAAEGGAAEGQGAVETASGKSITNSYEAAAGGPGAAQRVWTRSGRIKAAQLVKEGKIRYVPPKTWTPSQPLPRGPQGGYMDKFGNEWVKGPSRTAGEPFEWDVQLPDGTHWNISLEGKVTH